MLNLPSFITSRIHAHAHICQRLIFWVFVAGEFDRLYLWPLALTSMRCYVVKEVTSFPGLGQLMGVARKRPRAQALQTSRKKAV